MFGLLPGQNLILPASFIDPGTFVDDLFAFLAGQGLEKIRIVGWSMGAQLALECALAFPVRVSSLDLYAIRKNWPEGEIEEIRAGITADFHSYMVGFYRKCFLGYKKFYTEFVRSLQEEYLVRIDRNILLAGLDYLEKYTMPDRAPSGVHTRIIHGRKDVVAPVDEMVDFAGINGEIIRNAGHMVILDTLL